ncbi:hypothetical protein HDU81_010234 [Chytriomyces hyalinus]|nr:hypothetical protein HDU81_010234 [Chytriomyces hyalinus]
MLSALILTVAVLQGVFAHGPCQEAGDWGCDAGTNQLWQCDGAEWRAFSVCAPATACTVTDDFVGCVPVLDGSSATRSSPSAATVSRPVSQAPVSPVTSASRPASSLPASSQAASGSATRVSAAPASVSGSLPASVSASRPATAVTSRPGVISGSGENTICNAATDDFACDSQENFLNCRNGRWAVSDRCAVDNGKCTLVGGPGFPDIKGCLPDPANYCPQSAYGSWRCVGSRLQQCAFDPYFVTIADCATSGTVCRADANFAGCLIANRAALVVADATPVAATSGLSTAGMASIGVVASVGVVAAVVGTVLYRRGKKVAAVPTNDSFVVA